MPVGDARARQRHLQLLAVEVGQLARARQQAHVGERFDPVRGEQLDKLGQGPGRMPNCVDFRLFPAPGRLGRPPLWRFASGGHGAES
jgi:hypothetical protein